MNTMHFRNKHTKTSKATTTTVADTLTTATLADPEITDTAVLEEGDEYEMQDFSERRGF